MGVAGVQVALDFVLLALRQLGDLVVEIDHAVVDVDAQILKGLAVLGPVRTAIIATVGLWLCFEVESALRNPDAYEADFRKAVDLMLAKNVIPIVSTIPPHPNKNAHAAAINDVIRKIAKEKGLPLIDYEKEILTRRPDDWNGTLLGKNDVHPSASFEGATGSSAPTAENLKKSGYLLRGWLSVQKIAEVKAQVLDPAAKAKP